GAEQGRPVELRRSRRELEAAARRVRPDLAGQTVEARPVAGRLEPEPIETRRNVVARHVRAAAPRRVESDEVAARLEVEPYRRPFLGIERHDDRREILDAEERALQRDLGPAAVVGR